MARAEHGENDIDLAKTAGARQPWRKPVLRRIDAIEARGSKVGSGHEAAFHNTIVS